MITASVYGRLGGDPVERLTKNSKAMTTATVAVDAARHGADADTVWFGLVAFGVPPRPWHATPRAISSAAWGAFTETATPPATARNGKVGPSPSSPSCPLAP